MIEKVIFKFNKKYNKANVVSKDSEDLFLGYSLLYQVQI